MRQVTNIMEKEMSRKEFLATLGFGLASVFGFSTVLKLIFNKGHSSHLAPAGYGSSVYGGQKESR